MSYIIPRRLRVERVLRRQHGGGDHDAEQDHVAEVGVVAEPVAPLSQEVGGREDEEAVLRGHRLRLGRHRRRLPLVGELLLLVVFLFTWHLGRRERSSFGAIVISMLESIAMHCHLVAVFSITLSWTLVILSLVVVVDCNLQPTMIKLWS